MNRPRPSPGFVVCTAWVILSAVLFLLWLMDLTEQAALEFARILP